MNDNLSSSLPPEPPHYQYSLLGSSTPYQRKQYQQTLPTTNTNTNTTREGSLDPQQLAWISGDPNERNRLLQSNPWVDWYAEEMVNLIFVAIILEFVAILAFGIFFFLESTTWTYSGSSGVLGSAIAYTIVWILTMVFHFGLEWWYWLARGKSTYNANSAENCRRVWNMRICTIALMTTTFIYLWVFYGTGNGQHMLKSYDEPAVISHGGNHGDLLLLHQPQRINYPLLMMQLGMVQFIILTVVFWNMLGYDLGDGQYHTRRFLTYHWKRFVASSGGGDSNNNNNSVSIVY